MTWDGIFALANGWALVAWLALLLLPRGPRLYETILFAGVGLLCLAYLLLLGSITTGLVDPLAPEGAGTAGFTSIQGVRRIFASDGGLVTGWVHYLALDMFAGLWIARDADRRHVSRWLQTPILVLTFLAGPAGFLLWIGIRGMRRRRTKLR